MALTFEDGYQYDDGEAHWENLKAVRWFQEQDARSKHPVPDADQHRDSDSHNRETVLFTSRVFFVGEGDSHAKLLVYR